MNSLMKCFFCGTEYSGDKIHFRDNCPSCGRDLHICHSCFFFDPHAHQQCLESVNDPVRDKERANFCEYFRPGGKQQANGNLKSNAALEQLEALFKKK